MSLELNTPKTGTSGDSPSRGVKQLAASSRITRSMSKERVSWRRGESKRSEVAVSPIKKFHVDRRENRREKILMKCEEQAKVKNVPFFITVMGKGGKLLLNVYPNKSGQREVQLFFNKGKYNDGLQIVRSCLRNMLSFDFDKIVVVNVYRGFYMAIQTNHTNESTQGYHTDKKYKNNIGLLEYVDLDDIEEFADECSAIINPKVMSYLDEVRKYIQICKEVTSACI